MLTLEKYLQSHSGSGQILHFNFGLVVRFFDFPQIINHSFIIDFDYWKSAFGTDLNYFHIGVIIVL